MADAPLSDVPSDEIGRRLDELARLYALGRELRVVRLAESPPPDRASETPPLKRDTD